MMAGGHEAIFSLPALGKTLPVRQRSKQSEFDALHNSDATGAGEAKEAS